MNVDQSAEEVFYRKNCGKGTKNAGLHIFSQCF